MAGERKPLRQAREAEFFAPSASGEYVYTGSYYAQSAGPYTWKQAMVRRWVMGLAMAALAVLDGCIPVPGMSRTAYVLLPYAAELTAICALLWAVGRMAAGGERLREYVYEQTVMKLPVRTVLAAVFAGLTVAGESLYLLLHGPDGAAAAYTAVFLLTQAGVLILSILWRRMEAGIRWEK